MAITSQKTETTPKKGSHCGAANGRGDSVICVIIPARNEEKTLGRTLASVLAQVEPTAVFVANDGSTDRTEEIAREHQVNVVSTTGIGKGAAIKAASDHFGLVTRFSLVSLMDSDTVVSPDYFETVQAVFYKNPTAAAVCGRVRSHPHNGLTAYRAVSYTFGQWLIKDAQSTLGTILVIPGCGGTYRSECFSQLEWKSSLTEDLAATIEIHRKKLGRILYVSNAHVVTQDPRTLKDYARQMLRWYGGALEVGRAFKLWQGLTKVDWEYKLFMLEALFFSMLWLLTPILIFIVPGAIIRLLVLDTVIVTVIAGGCSVADRRWDILLWSPLYLLMRFADCFLFLWAFYRIIVGSESKWRSPSRYLTGETT